MIIKIHIKLILNMYNFFSKFYRGERERERERERENLCWGTKNYNIKTYKPKIDC